MVTEIQRMRWPLWSVNTVAPSELMKEEERLEFDHLFWLTPKFPKCLVQCSVKIVK